MGCDIHCYIEYRHPPGPNHEDGGRWFGFGGRINPGRNYRMFGYLAGVRSDGPPVVEPRGLPEDAAWDAQWDTWLHISDCEVNESGSCTREQAAQYHRSGSSYRYLPEDTEKKKPIAVFHPDWHTHSWVTPDEWEQAIQQTVKTDAYHYPLPEYFAMLAALRSLEQQGYEARVVFWFDN